MSGVWAYGISTAIAAIAVTGIAALAEVDLWTPMHARVSAVAMVFTAFMHYCWNGYRSGEMEMWFVTLVVVGITAAAPATHFLGFAFWSETYLYVAAGCIVATMSAHIGWLAWWNADHRYEERMRRILLVELEQQRKEEERKKERAAREKERAAEKAAEENARRFERASNVRLRWSDQTRTKIESVVIEIPEREWHPRRGQGTTWVEIEDATAEEGLALIRKLRATREWDAKILERGLDAKRPPWWLEHERKEVETRYLVVNLNVERTGAETARLRKGEFEGKPITALTMTEFQRLLRVLEREDQKGARYAREVFDATRPGSRSGKRPGSDRPSHAKAKMSIAEARDCLAVSENASLREITERARVLRQRNHPDKGGSARIFRDVSEALEVLNEYHGAGR